MESDDSPEIPDSETSYIPGLPLGSMFHILLYITPSKILHILCEFLSNLRRKARIIIIVTVCIVQEDVYKRRTL